MPAESRPPIAHEWAPAWVDDRDRPRWDDDCGHPPFVGVKCVADDGTGWVCSYRYDDPIHRPKVSMTMNKTFLRDMAERALSTYVQVLIGLLIAGTFTLNIDSLKAAGIAAIPAALSVVKSALASLVGDKNSASLDPQVAASTTA